MLIPSKGGVALLNLCNRFGYYLNPEHMTALARHLSILAGREAYWTPNYLLEVGRGQLPASRFLTEAIERAHKSHPPPPPDNGYVPPTLTCDCGHRFISNSPSRTHCYQCRPIQTRRPR